MKLTTNINDVDDLTNDIMDYLREKFNINYDSDEDDLIYGVIHNTVKGHIYSDLDDDIVGIPKDILKCTRQLVDYSYDEEEANYEEVADDMDDSSSHIFEIIKHLDEFLTKHGIN